MQDEYDNVMRAVVGGRRAGNTHSRRARARHPQAILREEIECCIAARLLAVDVYDHCGCRGIVRNYAHRLTAAVQTGFHCSYVHDCWGYHGLVQ